jgi:hypothetical protein
MQTIRDFLALGGTQVIQLVLELLVTLFGQKIVRHAYISCYKNIASLKEMQSKGKLCNGETKSSLPKACLIYHGFTVPTRDLEPN